MLVVYVGCDCCCCDVVSVLYFSGVNGVWVCCEFVVLCLLVCVVGVFVIVVCVVLLCWWLCWLA